MYTILFGGSTNFDQPRGYVSRAIANIWALFSLFFLASYTANLVKFMIANDEAIQLTGFEDPQVRFGFLFIHSEFFFLSLKESTSGLR